MLDPKVKRIEQETLEQLKFDYVPIGDVVREFATSKSMVPTKDEFNLCLDFVKGIVTKYSLDVLEGPSMDKLPGGIDHVLDRIRLLFETEGYNAVHYRFWLHMSNDDK